MKMLIFLIFFGLVAAVVLWKVRKADAEKDLARRQAMKHKQKQHKEAITPKDHAKWPTIIHAAGKGAVEVEEELPEPTMTAIKFKPVDQTGLQH